MKKSIEKETVKNTTFIISCQPPSPGRNLCQDLQTFTSCQSTISRPQLPSRAVVRRTHHHHHPRPHPYYLQTHISNINVISCIYKTEVQVFHENESEYGRK